MGDSAAAVSLNAVALVTENLLEIIGDFKI